MPQAPGFQLIDVEGDDEPIEVPVDATDAEISAIIRKLSNVPAAEESPLDFAKGVGRGAWNQGKNILTGLKDVAGAAKDVFHHSLSPDPEMLPALLKGFGTGAVEGVKRAVTNPVEFQENFTGIHAAGDEPLSEKIGATATNVGAMLIPFAPRGVRRAVKGSAPKPGFDPTFGNPPPPSQASILEAADQLYATGKPVPGSRVAPRSTPTVEQTITSALEELRRGEGPETVSLPPAQENVRPPTLSRGVPENGGRSGGRGGPDVQRLMDEDPRGAQPVESPITTPESPLESMLTEQMAGEKGAPPNYGGFSTPDEGYISEWGKKNLTPEEQAAAQQWLDGEGFAGEGEGMILPRDLGFIDKLPEVRGNFFRGTGSIDKEIPTHIPGADATFNRPRSSTTGRGIASDYVRDPDVEGNSLPGMIEFRDVLGRNMGAADGSVSPHGSQREHIIQRGYPLVVESVDKTGEFPRIRVGPNEPPNLSELRSASGARDAANDPRVAAVGEELGVEITPDMVRDMTGGPTRWPQRRESAGLDEDFARLIADERGMAGSNIGGKRRTPKGADNALEQIRLSEFDSLRDMVLKLDPDAEIRSVDGVDALAIKSENAKVQRLLAKAIRLFPDDANLMVGSGVGQGGFTVLGKGGIAYDAMTDLLKEGTKSGDILPGQSPIERELTKLIAFGQRNANPKAKQFDRAPRPSLKDRLLDESGILGYHGSPRPIEGKLKAQNVDDSGVVGSGRLFADMRHLADSPDVASEYAGAGTGANVTAAHITPPVLDLTKRIPPKFLTYIEGLIKSRTDLDVEDLGMLDRVLRGRYPEPEEATLLLGRPMGASKTPIIHAGIENPPFKAIRYLGNSGPIGGEIGLAVFPGTSMRSPWGSEVGSVATDILKSAGSVANQLRIASMLSGLALPKSLLGNAGAIGTAAIEHGTTAPIREAFRIPTNLREAKSAWRGGANPSGIHGAGRLNIPGRMIGTTDQVTQKLLERAGLSTDEAQRLLLTRQNNAGKSLGIDNPAGRALFPFQKTPFNSLKEGFSGENWSTPKRAAMTVGAAGAGDVLANYTDDPRILGLAAAFAGPRGVPALIGAGFGGAGRNAVAGISPLPEWGIPSDMNGLIRLTGIEPAALRAYGPRRVGGGRTDRADNERRSTRRTR